MGTTEEDASEVTFRYAKFKISLRCYSHISSMVPVLLSFKILSIIFDNKLLKFKKLSTVKLT